MGFGLFNRVALLFDAPFWEPLLGRSAVLCRARAGRAAAAPASGLPRFECFVSMAAVYRGALSPPPPVLLAVLGGADAAALEGLSRAEVRAAASHFS